jgi:hypothetical protein
MHPVALTCSLSALTQRNFCDDATCTILVVPPAVFRPDWETLAPLASRQNKPLDLDVCPAPSSSSASFVAQPMNRSPLGFKVQTKKLSRWFWNSNHQTVAAGFEAQTGNPVPMVLWPNHWQTVDLGFRANQEIRPTSFEAKPLTNRSPWF